MTVNASWSIRAPLSLLIQPKVPPRGVRIGVRQERTIQEVIRLHKETASSFTRCCESTLVHDPRVA